MSIKVLGFGIGIVLFLTAIVVDIFLTNRNVNGGKIWRSILTFLLNCISGWLCFFISPFLYKANNIVVIIIIIMIAILAFLPVIPYLRFIKIWKTLITFAFRMIAFIWISFNVATSIWP